MQLIIENSITRSKRQKKIKMLFSLIKLVESNNMLAILRCKVCSNYTDQGYMTLYEAMGCSYTEYGWKTSNDREDNIVSRTTLSAMLLYQPLVWIPTKVLT